MRFDEPNWWYDAERSVAARLLQPIGALWGRVATHRYQGAASYRAALPVICIGNFTAGGTGKTPVALAIAAMLQAIGWTPVFLSRGYGGRLSGPHWVDGERDAAAAVGDEPLLLARAAPVVVARDRVEGARAIEKRSLQNAVIVMDDGLQNAALKKDFSLAVVDGRRGLGNGRVIPAGPLRAPLQQQMTWVDAVLVNRSMATIAREAEHTRGPEDLLSPADTLRWINGRKPVLRASTIPAGDVAWLEGAGVVAYAGIGAPGRFFDLLEHLGARVLARRAFGDHHAFRETEAQALLQEARDRRAVLVTTEKDLVRLNGREGALAALRETSRTLPIAVQIEPADREKLKSMVVAVLTRNSGEATARDVGSRDSA